MEEDLKMTEYIEGFPEETRAILKRMLELIHSLALGATEKMAYGIPTFSNMENLVHFAGFKNHIGFYPTPSAMSAFDSELSQYKHAKGSVQFPLGHPIPWDLIQRMVEFRLGELKAPLG